MRWSKEAMSESFFMTNMARQVGNNFNRRVGTATPELSEAHHALSRVERRHLSSDSERCKVANFETGQTLRGAVDQLLIGGDQCRCRHLGASQVEAVVHRMVDQDGDLSGTLDEAADGMNGDDPGETREIVKVRLRVRDFASPDLFPDRCSRTQASRISGACRSN